MFERILCPIDFSETSAKALQWAEIQAVKHNSEIIAVHVLDTSEWSPLTQNDIAETQALALTRLREFLEPVRVDVDYRISTGKASDRIVDLAETLCATVVIMGTRGLRAASRHILGSTTEHVIRHTAIPVMTISPHCHEPRRAGKLLLPVSHVQEIPRNPVRLRRMIQELGSVVHLVHVVNLRDNAMLRLQYEANPLTVTDVEEAEQRAALLSYGEKITAPGTTLATQVRFGNAAEEIIHELEEEPYDVVILGVNPLRMFGQFVGSVAYDIICASPIPVVTIKGGL